MKKIALALLLSGLLALQAQADVLARFTFDGSVRSSLDNNTGSNASNFNDGPGIISAFDTVRGNPAPSLGVPFSQIDGTTNTAAVAADDYFTFTITPVTNMSFTNLTFDITNYSNDGTFNPVSFFVRSSINGFASNIGSTQNVLAGAAGTFQTADITLTGASFQNLTAPVEFRIYIQESSTNTATNRGGLIDNVTLNGIAPVPEPATYMLLGLGALVCAQQFRRKKNS